FDIAEVLLQPALTGDQLNNWTNVLLWSYHFAADPRLPNLLNIGRIGQISRALDIQFVAVIQRNLIARRWIGNNQLQIIFTLQPLANDIHVQQPEEADAYTKAEHWRILGRELQSRVAETKLFNRILELLVMLVALREKTGVDKGFDILITREWYNGTMS